jgi:hypothetical protein
MRVVRAVLAIVSSVVATLLVLPIVLLECPLHCVDITRMRRRYDQSAYR